MVTKPRTTKIIFNANNMYDTGIKGNICPSSMESPLVPPTARLFGIKKKCSPIATKTTPKFTSKNLFILKTLFIFHLKKYYNKIFQNFYKYFNNKKSLLLQG